VANGINPDRLVVYVHGGGYICGSAGNQRGFLAELSRRAGAEVHAVEYRLAPEHPFPAAVDDVVAAYEGAIAAANGRPVVVGGDSAGGGLAIGSVVEMRRRDLQLPAAMFALSPWADMTLTSDTISSNADADVMVRYEDLKAMRECYIGSGDASHPTASPALADLTGMPPLLVHVGSAEILAGDSAALVDAARNAGVDAQLQSADGMFHIYPVLAPDLPESREAISSLAQFIRSAG
jgi:acetyl esterase/lipase